MELNNEQNNQKRNQEKWETFDVIATKENYLNEVVQKKSQQTDSDERKVPAALAEEASIDATKNTSFNGDVTLLNNNGKAPKRRLSSYTISAIEDARKSGRKRSSQGSHGFGVGKSRKASTMTTDSFAPSSSSYGLVLVPENQKRRVIPKPNSSSRSREQWGRKLEFLLAIVGFAVDLGNIWRFPYICFRNGGGAFLIPYFLMVVFGGVPLFYLELTLGQYHRTGCISIWRKICPIFKGVGYGICLMAVYVSSYYNTVIAWAFYYLFNSFTSELPWSHCNPEWADSNCLDQVNATVHNVSYSNQSQSPAHQFFERYVLELNESTGIGDIGIPRWQIVLCLLIVYVIIYFSLWKGIRSSGKVVWFTATFPYVVLIILLVRGVTLPGAGMGIEFYLKPKWEFLIKPVVWLEAATQVFFSLGPGFGTLIALSSYNQFDNNCYRDAIITSVVNCMTSFMAGFVVFSVMGYMAHLLGKTDIEDVTTPVQGAKRAILVRIVIVNVPFLATPVIDLIIHLTACFTSSGVSLEKSAELKLGVGLLFVVFSQALTTFKGSVFFSIVFFIMIITLGLDSSFGGLEAVITGLIDEFPNKLGKNREKFVLVFLLFSFLLALSTTTQGGLYLLTLLEVYATGVAIMTFVLIEAVAVTWFYGIERLCGDIKAMLGFSPGMFWKICWKYISPLFVIFMIIMGIISTENLQYGNYIFPDWSTVVGWLITLSSVSIVPAHAIYRYCLETGSTKQRCFVLLRPEEGGQAEPRESLAMTTVPE